MSEDIRALLERVQQGETSVEEALLAIKKAPYEDIDYAKIDLPTSKSCRSWESSVHFLKKTGMERSSLLPEVPAICRLRKKPH